MAYKQWPLCCANTNNSSTPTWARDECAVVGNGTLAIQLAMRALGVEGEVITTPFSYVATTSSIVWEGCIPVFVDVDATTFNIDPAKIEASIRGKCDYKTASDASPEYVYQMTNYFSNFISESRSFKRKIMRSYSKLFHGLGRTNYDWPHIIPFNKSPHLMNKLGYVGALFPRSTLIVIVRNIYSHSASMKIHFDKLHQMTGRTASNLANTAAPSSKQCIRGRDEPAGWHVGL
jgi:hypothetical protein